MCVRTNQLSLSRGPGICPRFVPPLGPTRVGRAFARRHPLSAEGKRRFSLVAANFPRYPGGGSSVVAGVA